MSSFIGFQAPAHASLKPYDPTKTHDAQPSPSIPETFLDAMSVREEVYVQEQHVPLENEFDTDDPKSYHWVAYASVATSSKSSPTTNGHSNSNSNGPPPINGDSSSSSNDKSNGTTTPHPRKDSAGSKLPAGTIRLVPPPHDDHAPSSAATTHNETPDTTAALSLSDADRESRGCLRRGREPYVKLGRLAILPAFRKLGLSTLLLNAALGYAASHPDEIMPPVSPTEAEHRRLELGPEAEGEERWEGLVLVHAQVGVERLWRGWGFVRDETMGEWDEEGIMHVGMWRRVEARRRKGSLGVSPVNGS